MKSRTSCDAIERGSAGFEDITRAAHGMDQLRLEGIVHLSPQPPNHDVDDVGVGGEVDVPDLGCDFRAGDHLAGGTDEMRQEEKFLRGQIQGRAGARRFVPAGVDFQIADAEHVPAAGSARAGEGTAFAPSVPRNANGFTR